MPGEVPDWMLQVERWTAVDVNKQCLMRQRASFAFNWWDQLLAIPGAISW